MSRRPVLFVLPAAAWALSVVAAGCTVKPAAGPAAERLSPAQGEQLLRAVTLPERPADTQSAGAPCRGRITTARPAGIHLADPSAADLPVRLRFTIADTTDRTDTLGRLSYEVLDFQGRKVAGGRLGELAVPKGGRAVRTAVLKELKEIGWYEVVARLNYSVPAENLATGKTTAGVAVFRGGFSILDFDADRAGDGRLVASGPDGAAGWASRWGGGWFYCRDLIAGGQGVTNWHERSPERQWQPRFDATGLQNRVAGLAKSGLKLIGHIGPGPLAPAATSKGGAARTVRLPDEAEEFAAATAPLVELLPEVADWDIAPGRLDDLAGSAARVRRFIRIQTAAIAARRKDVRFWATSSPAAANDLLTAPGPAGGSAAPRRHAAGLLDGLRFDRGGASADFAAWVARRAGAAEWIMALPPPARAAPGTLPQERAWQVVTGSVDVLRAGGRPEVQLANDDTAQAAAQAFLADRLGDGRFREPAWPALEPHIRSPIFSGRRGSVAVLWTAAAGGGEPGRGLIEIPEARYIRATDCMGQRVGLPRGRALVVPLGQGPIYISAPSGAKELARQLRSARIEGLAPVDFAAECITRPVDGRARVTVQVASLVNQAVEVSVSLRSGDGWVARRGTQTLNLGGGRTRRLTFEFDKARRRIENAYPLRIRATVGQWSLERVQVVHEATAARMTPKIDGRLDEWTAAAPMTVGLPLGHKRAGQTAPAAVSVNARQQVGSRATVRLAWDREFLYVAAEVDLAGPLERTRTVVPQRGPDGRFESAPWGTGSIQLAFGGPQPKHVFALSPTAGRPVVVRLGGPGMELRNPRRGLPINGWGEVPGSRAVIVEAGGRAVYEAAIPRKQLGGLPWSAGSCWEFGFLVDAGDLGQAQWAEAAGVFARPETATAFWPIGRRRRGPTARLGLTGQPR